jgi:hypothetical protein
MYTVPCELSLKGRRMSCRPFGDLMAEKNAGPVVPLDQRQCLVPR